MSDKLLKDVYILRLSPLNIFSSLLAKKQPEILNMNIIFFLIIFGNFWTYLLLILGQNGLQEFQRIATQQGWLILAYETFDRTPDPRDIDVTLQLKNILETGTEN